jgi:hypothetical protein
MVGRRGPGSRTLRGLLLGSGPLKRGSDRLEVLGRLAAVLMVVLAVPVALAVGTAVFTDTRALASEQTLTRTTTEAVLTAPARAASYADVFVPTPASWTSPDGRHVEGNALARVGAEAGDRVRIWVDPQGRRTRAPLDPAGVAWTAAGAGLMTFLLLVAGTVAGWVALGWLLWRSRSRTWERDWLEVEPRWAGRR